MLHVSHNMRCMINNMRRMLLHMAHACNSKRRSLLYVRRRCYRTAHEWFFFLLRLQYLKGMLLYAADMCKGTRSMFVHGKGVLLQGRVGLLETTVTGLLPGLYLVRLQLEGRTLLHTQLSVVR